MIASILACTMITYRAGYESCRLQANENSIHTDCSPDIINMLNLTGAFELDHVGETSCVTFHRGKVVRKSFVKDAKSPYGWYHGMAERFLTDVAATPHLRSETGTAVIRTEDDATLPPSTVLLLASMGSPLLAHSIRKSSRPGAILIPDWHFIEHNGFRDLLRVIKTTGTPLRSRKRKVFWRGSTTGLPCAVPFVSSSKSTALSSCPKHSCDGLHRVAATRIAKSAPWLDIKISRTLMWCNDTDAQRLSLEGLSVEEVRDPGHQQHDEATWILNRGLFEIDGFVNAWGHLWRMSSGSAVFKVESEMTNAYIEQEVSGVHFISVMSNLSDLAERTQMITDDSYLPYLKSISRNAKSLASSFTYDQEVDRVAREIRKNWIEHRKEKKQAT